MKNALLISFLLATVGSAVGCASVGHDQDRMYTDRGQFRGGQTTALAFDPPITAYAPDLDLDRENRSRTAFVGYDSVIITSYTRQDDRQFFDGARIGSGRSGFSTNLGYLDRQSYTETVAVRQK